MICGGKSLLLIHGTSIRTGISTSYLYKVYGYGGSLFAHKKEHFHSPLVGRLNDPSQLTSLPHKASEQLSADLIALQTLAEYPIQVLSYL